MQDRRESPPEGTIDLRAFEAMWGDDADEPKAATLTPSPRPKDPARVAVGV